MKKIVTLPLDKEHVNIVDIENKIVFESQNIYVFELSKTKFDVRANLPFTAISLGIAKTKEQAIRCAQRLDRYPKHFRKYIDSLVVKLHPYDFVDEALEKYL